MAFAGFSGIENRGTATVTNCTIVDNPDGIKNVSGTTTVRNSIVAGNTTNTVGAVSNGGNNILTGTAAAAGLQGNGNNGGQTNTFALVPGSPAIDAGNNAFIPSGITTDQRGSGFPRILYNTVDIGAFEFGVQIGPNVTVNTTDDHDDGRCDTLDCSLREAINVANSDANASVIGFSSLFINSAQTISLGSALPHITTNDHHYWPRRRFVESAPEWFGAVVAIFSQWRAARTDIPLPRHQQWRIQAFSVKAALRR